MKNYIAGLLMVMGSALLLPAQAAPICVTTWDLGTNGWSNNTTESLKKLHPDVILLQQVADWETCHQLAQALQPATYHVAIFSSFRDSRGELLRRQVAILCKGEAYRAWSEQTPASPGGFAFAAIQLGDKNIGVFSVELSEGAARPLARQITSVENWTANPLQALIVAGNLNAAPDVLPLVHEETLLSLEHIGFESPFAEVSGQETPDYIFTRDARVVSLPVTTQSAVTFQMDLIASQAAPAPPLAVRTELSPPKPRMIMVAKPAVPTGHRQPLWWLAGGLAGCVALFVLARKRSRRADVQLVSTTSPDLRAKTRVIVATPQIEAGSSTQTQSQTWPLRPDAVREGVIAHLTQWLKQKFVQRLVSDRAQLLATQQAAALKVLAVDQRLANVEHHIEQRSQQYEQRIDDLLKALITAREENRELIRAKIALLKAEMEKDRRN
jgi:hypothetical protein